MKNALFKWRHFLIPFHFTSFTLPHISTPNCTKSIVPLPHFLSRFHFPAATPELSINFLFTHSLPAEALVLMPTVPRFRYCCPRVTTANFVSDSDIDDHLHVLALWPIWVIALRAFKWMLGWSKQVLRAASTATAAAA